MKKSILLLLAGMWVMGTSFNLHAALNNPVPSADGSRVIVKFKIDPLSSAITLQLANLERQRTQVLLEDMQGGVWHSGFVWGEKGYIERFNFEGMPDGDYLFYVGNSEFQRVQLLNIHNGEIQFFEERPYTPVIRDQAAYSALTSYPANKQGKLITFLTQPDKNVLGVQLANLREKPFTISINKIGAGKMFSYSEKGVQGYAQRLNMEGMQDGMYYLRIATQDRTLVQFFSMDKENGGILFEEIQSIKTPVNPQNFAVN